MTRMLTNIAGNANIKLNQLIPIIQQKSFNTHRETLNQMEMFYIDQNKSWFNEVYNQLCGVWDGYLYIEMLESAKQYGLPTHILQRIANTIQFIGTRVK